MKKKDRDLFLNHIKEIAKYWASLSGTKEPIEIAEGTAFSILVAIDGEAAFCGPYALRPIDDKGHEGDDIAGALHEQFSQME